MITGNFHKQKNVFESYSNIFKANVNKHTPLNEKIVRGKIEGIEGKIWRENCTIYDEKVKKGSNE